jgi:hypothetical protein
MALPKKVYWKLIKQVGDHFNFEFWTKDDKSNAINEKVKVLTDEAIVSKIKNIVNYKSIELVRKED